MASPGESKVDDNEVTSELNNHHHQSDGGHQDLAFPLMHQSSIYSLTLDEIQNTVCEPGKSFGSMNMDEFLNNIWNVEEGAAANAPNSIPHANAPNVNLGGPPPLHRQGSITLPAPLCRKTVDEVWAEIHREQEDVHHPSGAVHHGGNTQSAHRQWTLGEMTLEDFLIKAGVVREGIGLGSPNPVTPGPMQHDYRSSYLMAARPMVGPVSFEYQAPHGKRCRNGYGMKNVGVGSPGCPVPENGFSVDQVDSWGLEGDGIKGNNGSAKRKGMKRWADVGVEKVVERRQRRMIKNRESAARSRARKQAYTVELEAELNLLKEENARLREEERRAQALRKQMMAECRTEHAQAKVAKTARSLRRCNSGPW